MIPSGKTDGHDQQYAVIKRCSPANFAPKESLRYSEMGTKINAPILGPNKVEVPPTTEMSAIDTESPIPAIESGSI